MKSIRISDEAYAYLKWDFKINCAGEIFTEKGLSDIASEIIIDACTIEPSKKEKSEWKEYLYNTLLFLASERKELFPRKKDSFNDMLESFMHWASEHNDGYFTERDISSDYSRYEAFLEEQYDVYEGGVYDDDEVQ